MSAPMVLWQEGPFCCELRTSVDPAHLVVTKNGDDVVEVVVRSELEIIERSGELRALVMAHRQRT